MENLKGTFIWYELNTHDVDAAVAFYTDVIGWETEVFSASGMPYVRWIARGIPVGGVLTLPPEAKNAGAPPHWTGYVAADDVDALTRQAESLGGKTCVPPADIPNVGRFSIVEDPQGASIALFKGMGSPEPRSQPPAAGDFSWRELMTTDQEAAMRFYAQLFGWEKTEAVPMPGGTYQLFGRGTHSSGGIMARPEDYPAPPHWLYYVYVDDLDGALARVAKGGGQVLNGPMDIPGGDRVAQCMDPQRATFALHGK